MTATLERKITLGFGAALFLMCVVAVVSYRSIRQFVSNSDWEDHTREVLLVIAGVSSDMAGAESASRGYVISGDEQHLPPYHTAADDADAKLRELRTLTADNPSQQRRLDRLGPLVKQKLALLDESVVARRKEGFTAAQQLVLDGQGKRIMDDVTGLLADMRGEEGALLKTRSATALSSARVTILVISGGGALAVLLVALAATLIRRDITRRKATEEALRHAEEKFRLLVESVQDYAIFMLDPEGVVTTWNTGAERINGYKADEILGRHFSKFYPTEDVRRGKCEMELRIASETGRFEEEGWRVRKDGSQLWANVVISAVRDNTGTLRGFAKVTRDMTARKRAEDDIRKLNEALKRHAAQLESANKELEAFCYSVSHDLRAPLRSIDGFSLALMEDYGDKLEPDARDYLKRVRAATQRMAQLIDDLLNLSRVSRGEMSRSPVDLTAMARAVATELQKSEPDRQVEIVIADGLVAEGDTRLLRVVLDNLLGNAWKFTARRTGARIEFGASGHNGTRQFFVRDNGAGFDMAYAHKLFGAFQRLHGADQFGGTGVGLATVQRIINRHGGQISAEGEVEKGATFRFTL